MPVKYPSEREQFKSVIRAICKNITGSGWQSRYVLHDWDLYFDLGFRAKNAREAFDMAIECE